MKKKSKYEYYAGDLGFRTLEERNEYYRKRGIKIKKEVRDEEEIGTI